MMKLTIDGCSCILKNKYYKWYCNIIQKRIEYPLEEEYGEVHHILPRCMGGSNKSENLIFVSAREHFVLHALLVKFTTDKFKYKMAFAFNAMRMKSKNTLNRYHNSRLYDLLKKEHSVAVKMQMKRLREDPEYCERHSRAVSISWYDGSRDKQLDYMKKNSPFRIKEIHEKTINARTNNHSNIFETNNPMKKDGPSKALKVLKTSGTNHYSKNKFKIFLKEQDKWFELDFSEVTLSESLIPYNIKEHKLRYALKMKRDVISENGVSFGVKRVDM